MIEDAVESYKGLYKRSKVRPGDKQIQRDMESLEKRFFNENPLMSIYTMSGNYIIKELRRQVDEESRRIVESHQGQTM